MDLQTQATAPAPAGYVPDQDDLDQMAKVHSIHDVLDLVELLLVHHHLRVDHRSLRRPSRISRTIRASLC